MALNSRLFPLGSLKTLPPKLLYFFHVMAEEMARCFAKLFHFVHRNRKYLQEFTGPSSSKLFHWYATNQLTPQFLGNPPLALLQENVASTLLHWAIAFPDNTKFSGSYSYNDTSPISYILSLWLIVMFSSLITNDLSSKTFSIYQQKHFQFSISQGLSSREVTALVASILSTASWAVSLFELRYTRAVRALLKGWYKTQTLGSMKMLCNVWHIHQLMTKKMLTTTFTHTVASKNHSINAIRKEVCSAMIEHRTNFDWLNYSKNLSM